jgi:hypothetical protein
MESIRDFAVVKGKPLGFPRTKGQRPRDGSYHKSRFLWVHSKGSEEINLIDFLPNIKGLCD